MTRPKNVDMVNVTSRDDYSLKEFLYAQMNLRKQCLPADVHRFLPNLHSDFRVQRF